MPDPVAPGAAPGDGPGPGPSLTPGGSPNPAAPEGRVTAPAAPPPTRSRSRSHAVDRRLARLADALPDWMGSIRFRLTALYSLLLFALAAAMVAGLYVVLAHRLHEEKVYGTYEVTRVDPAPGGFELTPVQVRAEYRSVEQLANERALALLRTYSTSALGLLFLASLGVGWVVAGRVLAPIGRITGVARDIQATDLSRRIALPGPPDELKELADTFDAMLARLDDAFEGQRRFIQEASHELRNPLAVIRTNLDVALADPDPDPEELRRTAELVSRTASRMSRLVDDLLAYARSGSPAHEVAPVDVATLVAEAADEFRAPAALRGITVHVEVAPDVVDGPDLVGDRIALRQALANLLTNAVRLAPEGSTIQVAARREGGCTCLSVSDEGPGVAPGDRELVFQRFWRGDQASGRGEGRSGLGLAIVDQIARDHEGTVDLAPSPSGGSTFTLRLPTSAPPPPA
jgi:signal transduction histidine kinase